MEFNLFHLRHFHLFQMSLSSSVSLFLVLLACVVSCQAGCGVRRVVHRTDHPECAPKTLISIACTGQCSSYTEYSLEYSKLIRDCQVGLIKDRVTRFYVTMKVDSVDKVVRKGTLD